MLKATLVVLDQCNVKFEGLDPDTRHRMNTALKYVVPGARYMPSVKLGRWDGTVSFCTLGGATFINLLDHVLPIITRAGYDITIDDRRPTYRFEFPVVDGQMFADHAWPSGHELAGQPIVLRDYQVSLIQRFLDNLQGMQEISVGAGKTLSCAALSEIIQPYGRSMIIVPSKNLVVQTEEDYRNVELDVGVLYGERKEWGHQHIIATWQSLASLSKQSVIDEFAKDLVCVIGDECHSIRGKVLKDLLTGSLAHAPIRWGMTGTMPKEEHEMMCLLAAIGPKVGELRTIELQELDVLADCQVEAVQLQDQHVKFSSYENEHEFLMSNPDRLRHIADMVRSWTEAGSTLLLVDRVETGEILAELLGAVFIYGKVKLKARQKEYKSFHDTDNKIVIATYGVASTGINIPRIFNLVLLEPGKSFIRVLQSIGRGLRRASDKDYIRIVDLCSSLKFSARHLAKRKAYYIEKEHPYTFRHETYL